MMAKKIKKVEKKKSGIDKEIDKMDKDIDYAMQRYACLNCVHLKDSQIFATNNKRPRVSCNIRSKVDHALDTCHKQNNGFLPLNSIGYQAKEIDYFSFIMALILYLVSAVLLGCGAWNRALLLIIAGCFLFIVGLLVEIRGRVSD
jgi:hypothetical protein